MWQKGKIEKVCPPHWWVRSKGEKVKYKGKWCYSCGIKESEAEDA